jgi:ubiquinone/menaquinone biosynthesis C-methylase UbiE
MNFSEVGPGYQPIAEEYYDEKWHPTCSNFGELSRAFLAARIHNLATPESNALEVGAGRSILAKVFEEDGLPLSRVTILDRSKDMLKHSERWFELGATPRVADARHTELPNGYFDLIVSSLGDPYDWPDFWRETRRVISEKGLLLFTTPSFEWSSRFRANSEPDKAEFVLRDGRTVLVPSFTRPLAQERILMTEAGFEVIEEFMPTKRDIRGLHSSKLSVLRNAAQEPVLYCFVLRAKSNRVDN